MKKIKLLALPICLLLLVSCKSLVENISYVRQIPAGYKSVLLEDLESMQLKKEDVDKIVQEFGGHLPAALHFRVTDEIVESKTNSASITSADRPIPSSEKMIKYIFRDNFTISVHTEVCLPTSTYEYNSSGTLSAQANSNQICINVIVELPLYVECFECPNVCGCTATYNYLGEQIQIGFDKIYSGCPIEIYQPDEIIETEVPCR